MGGVAAASFEKKNNPDDKKGVVENSPYTQERKNGCYKEIPRNDGKPRSVKKKHKSACGSSLQNRSMAEEEHCRVTK